MENNKKYMGKTYNASECCTFRKTKELYGGLSNMASGYPIEINNIKILSSEALYQLCRFPHLPQIQEKIIIQKSPMSAKMVCKPFRNNSRNDWNETRIKIMRWCLRVKLAQNYLTFGKLLESTFDMPIVEDSRNDDFWGAIRENNNPNILSGVNALGRLLMELRQFYNDKKISYEMFVIEPIAIPNFKILGQPIELIDHRLKFIENVKNLTRINELDNFNLLPKKNEKYQQSPPSKAIVSEPEIENLDSSSLIKNGQTKNNNIQHESKYAGQTELPF
jgi:ribA/ribD-fused uncharacterized protein